jgi:hypothetical protein
LHGTNFFFYVKYVCFQLGIHSFLAWTHRNYFTFQFSTYSSYVALQFISRDSFLPCLRWANSAVPLLTAVCIHLFCSIIRLNWH